MNYKIGDTVISNGAEIGYIVRAKNEREVGDMYLIEYNDGSRIWTEENFVSKLTSVANKEEMRKFVHEHLFIDLIGISQLLGRREVKQDIFELRQGPDGNLIVEQKVTFGL